MKSTSTSVLAERLTAQGLSGPPLADPVAVAKRLLAVQGQDPRGFRLAVRARTEGLTAADVEHAMAKRELLVTWLNRGTLHLVRSEDYPWLQALTTPSLFTSSARRLHQEGVSEADAERALATIERALAEEGPLTRIQLRERVDSAGVRTEGQAMLHLLFLAALRGIVVRGPMVGKQNAYVFVRDWLGSPQRVDRDKALAELARRYLVGHQPATDRDLAKWAGLPLRDARAGLAAIAAELEEGGDGLVRLAIRADAQPLPPPRLLGAFDPVLLGWTSREPILGPHRQLVTRNGIFHPFAMANGRAVAKWGWPGGKLRLEPLQRLSAKVEKAIEADAIEVSRFLNVAGAKSSSTIK
ncbi:MAG TPA: winged helix DNA-binding domain-containing protein [Solirubrobacterales bacterium]|nr:winged helix DNA-binding domain-containing protein [Solirubrobacterales bacterium]